MQEFKIFQKFNVLVCFFTDKKDGDLSTKFQNEIKGFENRAGLCQYLGIRINELYEMEQVHSTKTVIVNQQTLKTNFFKKTDALITQEPNVFLMVKAADCFPVVFFDPRIRLIAAIHAGWRGVIEKIFLEILLIFTGIGSKPEDILVGIGPAARKCCFLHKHFIQEKLPEWEKYIAQKGDYKSLDIASFIIDKLVSSGIKKENIEDCGICTIHNKNYFSHYRSMKNQEPEGRQATIIGLKG